MTAFAVMAGSMALAGQAHDEHNKDKDDAHRHHMSQHSTTTTIHHRGGSQTITYYHQAKHPGDPDYARDQRYGRHTNTQRHPGDPDYARDQYYGKHTKHKVSWYQAVTRRHRTGSTYRASEYRARLARLQAERNRQRDLDRDRDRDRRAHRHVHHDNGKHKGWYKGKGNPHRG